MWIREERHTQGAMAMAAKHGHDNNQAFVQWLAQEDNDQGLQVRRERDDGWKIT